MTTITDKIWAAIQRPLPSVTREEIEVIIESGMADTVTFEVMPMVDGALELLTAISKAVDEHGLRVILDPRDLIPYIPAAGARAQRAGIASCLMDKAKTYEADLSEKLAVDIFNPPILAMNELFYRRTYPELEKKD